MYDIIDLNSRKVAELRDIAKELNIARVDKLKKQELVYAILDEQAVNTSASGGKKADAKPEGKADAGSESGDDKPKGRGRQRAAAKKDARSKEDGSGDGKGRDDRNNRRDRDGQKDKDQKDGDRKDGDRKDEDRKGRDDRGDRGDRNDRKGRDGDRRDRNDRGDRNDRNHRRDRNDRNNRRDRDRDRLGEPEEHGFNFDGIAQAEGVLEVMPEGFGYLRSADYNYLNSPDDVYVSNRQIKAAGLQTGDNVVCSIRPPRKGDKYYPMVEVLKLLMPESTNKKGKAKKRGRPSVE